MKYFIYIDNTCIATVWGTEAAYEAWRHACALADIAELPANLVDGETGEVIESNNYEEEDDDLTEQDYEDYGPKEMGFDPYEGCYTYDC